MSAHIVQLTDLPIEPSNIDDAVRAWRQVPLPSSSASSALYQRHDGNSLVELIAFNDWPSLSDLETHRHMQWSTVSAFATGDFRREILQRVEEPKPTADHLPNSRYLQLRYVEVRPAVYNEYREWRERTIFEVIRESDQIKTFSAYHTAVSTKPGVMFLSGFDCDVDTYNQIFASERYAGIVQAAGDNYITGGSDGLATLIYKRLDE